MTKTYDLTPSEYKVISGITANTCANDPAKNKKEVYKALKADYLETKKADPNCFGHFEKWLNELNAKSGYLKPVTKEQRKERSIKLENLNTDFMQNLRANIAPKEVKKLAKTTKPIQAIKEAKNTNRDAKMAFLQDGLKAGIITPAQILHEVKEGHISLSDAMAIMS